MEFQLDIAHVLFESEQSQRENASSIQIVLLTDPSKKISSMCKDRDTGTCFARRESDDERSEKWR